MATTNERALINLINDSQMNRVELYQSFDKNDNVQKRTDEAARKGFRAVLGIGDDEPLSFRVFRNNANKIFTVIEEVLDTNLPLAWEGSPFFNELVETRNIMLGDKNEFVVKDASIPTAHLFAGNHWDTDRKKLPGNKAFSVKTEWVYVRVYDDIERFLKGITTLSEMIYKIQEAMRRYVDSLINTAFTNAALALPSNFVKTGTYDKDTMLELIDMVSTASQSDVLIAGTRTGLAKIMDAIDAKWISEDQKREMATTGGIVQLTGLGVNGIRIPQSFIPNTFNFAVNNKWLYVLPVGDKPVKVVFEGDTRARNLDEQMTHDQTVDIQAQTKLGVDVIFNNMFGLYKLP